MGVNRRTFLVSAAAAGALAGCLSSSSESDLSGGGGGDGTDGTSPAESATSSGSTPMESASSDSSTTASTAGGSANLDHPAATNLAAQPVLGPAVSAAPAVILAFEDPSCHNCERFNTNTFPELESKLIDTGKASYVYRNFPYAFEWGRPAMAALEATLDRAEDAFWRLKDHYFAAQSQFDESNVLDRTQDFLTSETNVDAAGVISDVESGKFDGAVQTDIDAGNAADVVSTPTFFLFREGEFVTEVRGAQSYQVFAQALGVQ